MCYLSSNRIRTQQPCDKDDILPSLSTMENPNENREHAAQVFHGSATQLLGDDFGGHPLVPYMSRDGPSQADDMLDLFHPNIPLNVDAANKPDFLNLITDDAGQSTSLDDIEIEQEELITKNNPIDSFVNTISSNSEKNQSSVLRTDNQHQIQSAIGFVTDNHDQSLREQFPDGGTKTEFAFNINNDVGIATARPSLDTTSGSSLRGKHTAQIGVPRAVDANVYGKRHFAEFGQTSPEAPFSDSNSSAPSMSAIVHCVNALEKSVQELIRREFMYQINRYLNAFGVKEGQNDTADVLVRSQVQSDTQVQDEVQTTSSTYTVSQQQSENHPPPNSQLQNLAQDQIHQPDDAFKIQGAEVPQLSVNQPSLEAAQAHGNPSVNQRPHSTSPIASTARNGRTRRNRRNGSTIKNPSLHCHLCLRRGTDNSPHVPCGNVVEGTCRKSICQKCISTVEWEGKVDLATALSRGELWICTHCSGVCPDTAQCFVYGRTSNRRRQKRQAERQAALAVKHRQDANIQPSVNRVLVLQPQPRISDAQLTAGHLAKTQNVSLNVVRSDGATEQAFHSVGDRYSAVRAASSDRHSLLLNAGWPIENFNANKRASALVSPSPEGSQSNLGRAIKRRRTDRSSEGAEEMHAVDNGVTTPVTPNVENHTLN